MKIITFLHDVTLKLFLKPLGWEPLQSIGPRDFQRNEIFLVEDYGPGLVDDHFYMLRRNIRDGADMDTVILVDEDDVEVSEVEVVPLY